jgi:hypothetical protein
VLFENLELTRTVVSSGGQVVDLPGVFVGRVPPYAGHFRSQRVRQAYDDLAQPARLLLEASVLPLVLLGLRRRPVTVLAGALAAVLLAETGRRRAGGASVYPRSAAWWALPWLGERSVCIWLALAQVPRGGAPYAGGRVRRAATPTRLLMSRTRQPLEADADDDRSGADGVGLTAAVHILETSA